MPSLTSLQLPSLKENILSPSVRLLLSFVLQIVVCSCPELLYELLLFSSRVEKGRSSFKPQCVLSRIQPDCNRYIFKPIGGQNSRSQPVQCFINPPTLAQSILARNPHGLGLTNGYQNTRFNKVANKSRILFARCTAMNYVRQSKGQVETSKLDLLTFRSALYSLIDSLSHIFIPLQRVCSLIRPEVRNVNFDSIKYTYI